MQTTASNVVALFEMERYVRRMGCAAGAPGVIAVVRDYLEAWPRPRVLALQEHAGWIPFDELQFPLPMACASDVRAAHGSLRVRCRELETSGLPIAPELLELDLFFYFAAESLGVHDLEFQPPPAYEDAGFVPGALTASWRSQATGLSIR